MGDKAAPDEIDELRSEYDLNDLGDGVRGKYAKAFADGTNFVLLDPDVARVFRDDDSVNEALRTLIRITRKVDV